ncbi:hypothetical protein ACI5KX_00325 [Erythrobacter sp. GH1-10]|uniref:hypothetical protein n=1 Tax=Erythrobacter sp. GH1-10 TaxID=3349334 RepID=UPI00387814EC
MTIRPPRAGTAIAAALVFAALGPSPLLAGSQEAEEAAAQESTPADQVLSIYVDGIECLNECLPLAKSLEKAFADEEARKEEYDEPIGRLGFAWEVNGQDAIITNARVKTYEVIGQGKDDPERQVVTAYFDNFDQPQVLDYYFVREDGRWALEEVVSVTPGREWVLSLMLRYGFYGHEGEAEVESEGN